jgi:hypothetical protein
MLNSENRMICGTNLFTKKASYRVLETVALSGHLLSVNMGGYILMQKTSYCRGTVCFRSNNAVSQAGVFVLDINGRSPCALLRTTHQIWVRSRRVPPYVLTVCIWMEASG